MGSNDVTPEGHVSSRRRRSATTTLRSRRPRTRRIDHTIEDVKRLYMLAYDNDLKSISYYRDGSRNEQVLYHKDSPADAKSAVAEAEALLAKHAGPVRRKLPDERQAITHKFRVGEQEGYMTVGLFDDGTPGEVFINVNKQGSTVSGLMDTVAMLTSYALQYGVPLQRTREQASRTPASNPAARRATSRSRSRPASSTMSSVGWSSSSMPRTPACSQRSSRPRTWPSAPTPA